MLNLLRRLRRKLARPYQLKTSILLASTLVIVALAVIMGAIAYDRLGRETMETAKRWAESVADLIASNNTQAFILGDIAAMESNLKEVALLPGISNLALFRSDGRALVEVSKSAVGVQSQVGGPSRMELPSGGRQELPGKVMDSVYESWAALDFGPTSRAWVRVHFSLEQRSAELSRLWNQFWLSLLLLVSLVLLSLNLIIAAALRPIRALSSFAARMPDAIGSQVSVDPSCAEAEQLSQTLNLASRRIAEEIGRVQAIVNTAAEAIIGLDSSGLLVAANPAATRIFGQSQLDILLGQSLEQLIQRLDLDVLRSLFVLKPDQTEAPNRVVRKDFRGIHSDGTTFPVEISLGQVNGDEGLCYVCIVRDVTRDMEVDRMKSEFIATAAHELRTPMVSIMGFTELMLERDYSQERRTDMLQTILRQSEILVKMINDLLDLARIEARQGLELLISSYPLVDLVGDSVKALLRNPNQTQVDIVPLPPVSVQVDPGKVQLALINLLGNAFKYSPAGGPVSISARLEPWRGKPFAVLEVQDAGIGMTPEQLDHVFERFYRADKSGVIPGTGLGLSMVKEIAELHSGKIEIQSQLGFGTTALLWLPISAVSSPD